MEPQKNLRLNIVVKLCRTLFRTMIIISKNDHKFATLLFMVRKTVFQLHLYVDYFRKLYVDYFRKFGIIEKQFFN